MSLVDGIWIRKRMAEKDARMARELQRRIAGPTAKRRAKKHRDRLTDYARACRAVDARDGKICRLCTTWAEFSAHHHHIVPRSLGGPHSTSNLIRICASCHAAIHGKRLHVTGDADGTLHIERGN
jgi:5-methylcytosine-specific restriction endonuclease McrA